MSLSGKSRQYHRVHRAAGSETSEKSRYSCRI